MSTLVFQNYEPVRTRTSLQMLLLDRQNEFRELANAIGYSTKYEKWEEFILRFSIEFDDCFKMWSTDENDHGKIHKAMTLMRQMSYGKSSMNEVTKLQNIAYRIANDFKVIYDKLG